MMLSSAHDSRSGALVVQSCSSSSAASASTPRPLRTLNTIHSAPHVIQLHPDCSPNLSGKRKTAVELLAESKASFYAKSSLPAMLQHHPNRSPMLQPSHPSIRIREHHALPALIQQQFPIPSSAEPSSIRTAGRQRGDGYYVTPPVEKRRLAIRKSDSPHLPMLNVTAVKRFLSRPSSVSAEMHGVEVRSKSGATNKLIGFFTNQQQQVPSATATANSGGASPTIKKVGSSKSRITFSEVLPCICQNNQPPELPHRMRRNNPSPPPPIPPKSPALNAKLRLLSQQQQQYNKNPTGIKPAQHPLESSVTEVKENLLFRRIQSEESKPLPTEKTVMPSSNTSSLLRHHLHKSLPDLNSPKNPRRNGRCVVGGKIRSASTDLDSCSSRSSSSRMSRSSSVHLGSSTSSDDESSNEDEPHCFRRPPATLSRSERATTSDYASRSPSFKYETASLVQTSQTCWTLPPPWLDEKDHITTENPVTTEEITHPVTTTPTDQVNRRRAFILRSKSDVGPSRFAPDLLPAVPPEFTGDVPRDLDLFFDTVGHLQDPTFEGRSCSPVTYFSSVSSVDSACRRVTTRHVDNQGESSDSEDMAATLQRRLLGSQPGMGEPSIIERNARIIKWLIKCRNVPITIPSSGSTGQLMKLSIAPTPIIPMDVFVGAKSVAHYGQSTRL